MLHQPRSVNIKKSNFFEVGFAVGQDGGRKASQGKSGLAIMFHNFKRLPTASVSTQSAFLLISSQKHSVLMCPCLLGLGGTI